MHQRIVVVSGTIEDLECEVTMQALVVVDCPTPQIVDTHHESNCYETRINCPFDPARDAKASGLRFSGLC